MNELPKDSTMTRLIPRTFGLASVIITFLFASALAAQNGAVHGRVEDAHTGDALPGANVFLVGTSLGASTGLNGRFMIKDVPPGSYTVRTTYIGYKTSERILKIGPGADMEITLRLEAVGVQGKEVVVTAQASGQNQAINQQLSSSQIVNVVSAARIQELPDANAAESLGRLPGISVLRTGGEADQVVIRGMAPRFNQVMINGVELPSTSADSRSMDISMISSNMLEGMEVKKTVTPDMDASVIGGVVNLELREAHVVTPGVPVVGLLVQGGYNALPDAYNKLNNYKYVGSVEDRFFNKKFGVFAQVDVERRNLTSNQLGATYENDGNLIPQYYMDALNLDNIARDRRRYDGALVLDYRLPSGTIKFSNFLSTETTNSEDRGEAFGIKGNAVIGSNQLNTTLGYTGSTLSVIMNALHFQYQLPIFRVNVLLSHSYTETKDPQDWTATFIQGNAAINSLSGVANLNPLVVPGSFNDDPSKSLLQNIANTNSFSRGRALSASVDLEANLNLSNEITSVIKFGGMERYQTRSYDFNTTGTQGLNIESSSVFDNALQKQLWGSVKYNNADIAMSSFVDPSYSFGKFLGGDYKMLYPLNYGELSTWANYLLNNVANVPSKNSVAYFQDQANSTMSDYAGHEDQSAGYVMATINFGPMITLIPGVRFQNLQTTYTGSRGFQNTQSDLGAGPYNHYDTTITQSHGFWLPDVALQFRPLAWFNVRLSYTNTLAYPDYQAIIPEINVSSTEGVITYNNFALVPSRSTNYDVYMSFYDNSLGLLTVGGFLKQIDNLIFQEQLLITPSNIFKYFPPGLISNAHTPTANPQVTTFINDPNRAVDYGLEFDWQTHFWYLPHPFDGLVLNVNYTHVFSKEKYPYVAIPTTGRSRTPFDTSYTTSLLYQPDNIANLSVGYDYKGFSIRISMIYQDKIFSGTNYWPQLRTTTSAYTRWDLSAKQTLPWYGVQIYGDISNLNSEDDIEVIQAPTGVPQSRQSYGMTGDLGLRVNF